MQYAVRVVWEKSPAEAFVDKKYSRAHKWVFDGGVEVPASASPQVVPPPMSEEHAVDPEEAFVASISSCHMLWFLSLAAERGFLVESYEDNAEGMLGKNSNGKQAMTRVTLRPIIKFGGPQGPSQEQVDELHHLAHEKCFIANSVTTEIRVAKFSEVDVRV